MEWVINWGQPYCIPRRLTKDNVYLVDAAGSILSDTQAPSAGPVLSAASKKRSGPLETKTLLEKQGRSPGTAEKTLSLSS